MPGSVSKNIYLFISCIKNLSLDVLPPGRAIERVCSGADGAGMVSSARALLAAVTRVLLLADMVVVRQLLLAKDKVPHE